MNEYKCRLCGKQVWRMRRALWFRSYCDEAGQVVWLWRITFWPFR